VIVFGDSPNAASDGSLPYGLVDATSSAEVGEGFSFQADTVEFDHAAAPAAPAPVDSAAGEIDADDMNSGWMSSAYSDGDFDPLPVAGRRPAGADDVIVFGDSPNAASDGSLPYGLVDATSSAEVGEGFSFQADTVEFDHAAAPAAPAPVDSAAGEIDADDMNSGWMSSAYSDGDFDPLPAAGRRPAPIAAPVESILDPPVFMSQSTPGVIDTARVPVVDEDSGSDVSSFFTAPRSQLH